MDEESIDAIMKKYIGYHHHNQQLRENQLKELNATMHSIDKSLKTIASGVDHKCNIIRPKN